MRVLIFGATGRTGRHLVTQGIARGWTVFVAGRDLARLNELAGIAGVASVDVADTTSVAGALNGLRPQAIISTIGGAGPDALLIDEVGNNAITDAAVACGVRRVLQVSSLACGDSRAYASERIIAAIGPVLDAKTRAEGHLRNAALDWTIVRPGGLTDGEPTGQGALYDDPRVHGRIARADLATLLLDALATPASIGRVLSAVDRTTLPAEPADIAEFELVEAV
ncbi:SDR family oxidoreductase [Rhodopseudomonas sp. G2_2311]|uniref:SDR family oxidoreductase n=1 Tax=Rhodopseudomonas sp. G2_2311 TaxID=3114287 RepID=UPI0039C5E95A